MSDDKKNKRPKKNNSARWQVVLQDPSGRVNEEPDSFQVTLSTAPGDPAVPAAPEDLLDAADDTAA